MDRQVEMNKVVAELDDLDRSDPDQKRVVDDTFGTLRSMDANKASIDDERFQSMIDKIRSDIAEVKK